MTKLWWHDYRIFVQSSSMRQSRKVVIIGNHDKKISGVTGSEHLNITHGLSIETEVLLSEAEPLTCILLGFICVII